MEYKFEIEWHVHMYCHIIRCTYKGETFKAVCESAPRKEKTILFWPEDFGMPKEQTIEITEALIKWADNQPFKYIIREVKGR